MSDPLPDMLYGDRLVVAISLGDLYAMTEEELGEAWDHLGEVVKLRYRAQARLKQGTSNA